LEGGHTEISNPLSSEDLVATVFPLVEAIRKMLAHVELIWSDVAVTPSEAAVLERLFIDYNGRARSGALLGYPIRSTPGLGKALASLEDSGLVTRRRDADDGRVVIVTGTTHGRELFDDSIERIVSEVVSPTTAGLNLDEFAMLRTITSKLRPPESRRS
jgi:DNA-binding MarR family transcriptional regulator